MNCDGQTEKIQRHLHEMHWPVYRELVLSHKLKGWEAIAQGKVPEGVGSSQKRPSMFPILFFDSRLI